MQTPLFLPGNRKLSDPHVVGQLNSPPLIATVDNTSGGTDCKVCQNNNRVLMIYVQNMLIDTACM